MEASEHTRAPGAVLEQCPHCRGAVRPDAPWCTQCWADLRPAPPPPPPVVAAAVPAPAVPAPAAGQPAEGTAPAAAKGWPCATCGHVNGLEHDACAACGTGMFAALRAAEEPLLLVPGLGDLTRYSRAQRLALAGGVVLVVCLLVLLVGVLLG